LFSKGFGYFGSRAALLNRKPSSRAIGSGQERGVPHTQAKSSGTDCRFLPAVLSHGTPVFRRVRNGLNAIRRFVIRKNIFVYFRHFSKFLEGYHLEKCFSPATERVAVLSREMRRVTVDIDTGGTHTDGFFARGEEVVRAKVETTPHDLTVCFQQCLLEGARLLGYSQLADLLADTAVVRFSTTIGTNTLIQRNGPKLGVLVTSGYENTLYAASAADHPVLGFNNGIKLKQEIYATSFRSTKINKHTS